MAMVEIKVRQAPIKLVIVELCAPKACRVKHFARAPRVSAS